jgi:hypothetical protein
MKVWMKYLILGAFALVCVIALNASSGHATAADLTWVGTASGHTHEPTAWNPAQAPQAGDNLTFNGGSNIGAYYMEGIALGKITLTTGWYGTQTVMADSVTATEVTIAGGSFNQNSHSLYCTWLTITNGSLAENGGLHISGLAANQWYRFVTTDNIIGSNKISDRQASAAGVIIIALNNWGTLTKFAMDEFPVITTSPVTTIHQTESYYYDVNASKAVTWTITFSDSQLSYDSNGIISGNIFQLDDINVTIEAVDSFGVATYQNYTITVSMPDYIGYFSPLMSAMVEIVAVIAVLGIAGGAFNMNKKRKK